MEAGQWGRGPKPQLLPLAVTLWPCFPFLGLHLLGAKMGQSGCLREAYRDA